MADFMVAGVLLMIVSAAVIYIVKAKKRGTKCIGCPAAGHCASKNGKHSADGCHPGI